MIHLHGTVGSVDVCPRVVRRHLLAVGVVFVCSWGAAEAQSLSGWTATNVGNPVIVGSASALPCSSEPVSGCVGMSVSGAGADIWSSRDEFMYVHKALHGDGTIVARVDSLWATHPWAKAGVMIRESLEGESRHAFMLVSASQGTALQWRSATGENSGNMSGSRASAAWVRLDRESSVITAYESADGRTWSQVGSLTMSLPTTVYVGVAVTSHNTSALTNATLSHVRVAAGGSGSLPSGWSAQDVGGPSIQGASAHADGAFAVSGAGRDIWNSFDQFQFVYRRVSGDVDVVAQVSSLQAGHVWAKAGVMIRATLDGGSSHASMFATGASGLAFQRRRSAGAASLHTAGHWQSAPVWVRLERRGSTVSAYSSSDGWSWTFVGSDSIGLSDAVYVGLAVTSHDAAASAQAVFDRVSITAAAGSSSPTEPVSEAAPALAPAPAPSSQYLSFTPSADHSTNVDGYTLQIVNAAAQAVAQQNLGKPSVSGGECRVDITTLLSSLPTGSYVAVVKAYNRYGTSSGASGSFTR